MTFLDIQDQPIDIGDIILYVYGGHQGVDTLAVGEVVRYSAHSMWVIPLDEKTFIPLTKNDYRWMDPDGELHEKWDSNFRDREQIVVGQIPLQPRMLKDTGRRFYILRKI